MQSSRIYVNVSYDQKDIAKRQGARWEPVYKKWFFLSKCIIDEKTTEFMGYEIYKFPKTKEVKKVEEIKKVINHKIYDNSCVCRFCANDKLTSNIIKSIKLDGFIFNPEPCNGCKSYNEMSYNCYERY